MPLYFSTPFRYALMLLLSAMLVSGCSNSSDAESPADSDGASMDAGNTTSGDHSENGAVQKSTRVNFDITVPVYVSNSLQVRLAWCDTKIAARWISDESWSAADDLPTNTAHLLVATFYDRNGEITLGSFEKEFKTGTNASESYEIKADQFDTNRWDSDSDGISNIDELIAGTNPSGGDTTEPVVPSELPQQVQASLELVADKTFRIGWNTSAGAEFYRVLQNPDGVSGFTQINADLDDSMQRLDHRVALYSKVNARYIVQACNARGCVDSDELIVSGSLERAIGYFKASNTDSGDLFGGAVSLSADGNTLAIGARGEASAATGINGNEDDNSASSRFSFGAGAVYVFTRINGSWQQQGYLKAESTDSAALFGGAVSLSANGNILAVGANGGVAYFGNTLGQYVTGTPAVYVFERINGNWQQQAHLDISTDAFGWAVSLSADGDTLVVGAISDASGATEINGDRLDINSPGTGAVYVYVGNNGNWEEQAYLKASIPSRTEQGLRFGDSVSLSADGNTLAVGTSNSGFHSGSAYVYVRSNGNWQEQALLHGSNHASLIEFGRAVALSADGNTLVVGAPHESGIAVSSGAVYVFVRSDGDWLEQAYLKASNTGAYDNFGIAVSISADGNALAVGAPDEESSATGINGNQDNFGVKAGAVYVFERSNGDWQQRAYVKASNTDSADVASNTIEDFGAAVSLSADGNTLAISATGEDGAATGINGDQLDNSAERAGAVYLY